MSSETKSWTDDLPVCNFTGAGFSTNQVYSEDGSRRMEAHKFNERSFHCQVDENTLVLTHFSPTTTLNFALIIDRFMPYSLDKVVVRLPSSQCRE